MAIINVVTTAGAALHASGVATTPTRIEVGQGHVTSEAAALARTSLVNPFSPARRNDSPAARASGNQLQTLYQDSTTAAYNVREVAVFSGSTLMAYACDDAGGILRGKSSTVPLHLGVLSTFNTPVNATPAVTLQPFAVATTEDVGAVRLAADGDTTSTGLVVVSPAQAQTIAEAAAKSAAPDVEDASTTQKGIIEVATATEINTGTDNEKAVSPGQLAASRYVQVMKMTQAQYNALSSTAKANKNILYLTAG